MIALYKGTSPISRVIRCFHRSPYSHASFVSGCGLEYEAWKGGVRTGAFGAAHTPGTEVDLYLVAGMTGERARLITAFLKAKEGKPYDYWGVVKFITRRKETPSGQDRWFCSELVFSALRAAGIELLMRIPAYQVYPGMLAYSPLLTLRETIRIGKPGPSQQWPQHVNCGCITCAATTAVQPRGGLWDSDRPETGAKGVR